MQDQKNKKEPKVADSEGYNVEKPQNQNTPLFNSTTSHRKNEELPSVENFNQNEGLKDDFKAEKDDKDDSSALKDDQSLRGNSTPADLGNGQRDKDEDEDEKIIRT